MEAWLRAAWRWHRGCQDGLGLCGESQAGRLGDVPSSSEDSSSRQPAELTELPPPSSKVQRVFAKASSGTDGGLGGWRQGQRGEGMRAQEGGSCGSPVCGGGQGGGEGGAGPQNPCSEVENGLWVWLGGGSGSKCWGIAPFDWERQLEGEKKPYRRSGKSGTRPGGRGEGGDRSQGKRAAGGGVLWLTGPQGVSTQCQWLTCRGQGTGW